jgi:phage baseplate assembly protein W
VHRENSFVGTGWNWPVETDATGMIALVSGTNEIEQAMYLVLATAPGERPMRPEFGCRLQEFVFAPADAATAALVGAEVRASLARWEPRITVDDVLVSADSDEPSTLWIDVRYTVLSTNDRRNLVFPFYVIPQHD